MSTPTGEYHVIREMNELLGRELGRNQYGAPYFTWEWSNDLIWPWLATGKMTVREEKVRVPIIGAPEETHDFEEAYDAAMDTWDSDFGGQSGKCVHCGEPETASTHNVYAVNQHRTPEYAPTPQVRKRDTWYIAKWMTPWELILGPGRGYRSLKHGDQQNSDREPPVEAVMDAWSRLYPGAEFPARGLKFATSAYLPASPLDENWAVSPHGKTVPNLLDTKKFIREVKFQTSRSFEAVEKDMMDKEDAKNVREELAIGEECANDFSAFLNPAPGKRGRASGGGFISFPWSRKDRER